MKPDLEFSPPRDHGVRPGLRSSVVLLGGCDREVPGGEGAENASVLVRGLAAVRVPVLFRSVPLVVRVVLARVGLLLASGDRRDAEILALRHQLLW